MWKCKKCGEELEDSFDSCWQCGTYGSGASPPPTPGDDESPPADKTFGLTKAIFYIFLFCFLFPLCILIPVKIYRDNVELARWRWEPGPNNSQKDDTYLYLCQSPSSTLRLSADKSAGMMINGSAFTGRWSKSGSTIEFTPDIGASTWFNVQSDGSLQESKYGFRFEKISSR